MKEKIWKRILTLGLAASLILGDSAIGFAMENRNRVASGTINTDGHQYRNGIQGTCFRGKSNTL